MSKREAIRSELTNLYKDGAKLLEAFRKTEKTEFRHAYQNWYSKALPAVSSLAPDRYAEFRGYYEIDPKRKQFGYGTYVIQDYIKNVVPTLYADFDDHARVVLLFYNQLTILNSIKERVESVVANIESELFAEIQDNEVAVARRLSKVSLRAAGALVGVVIEGHLQKVAAARGVTINKKYPTIADLNDPLKAASIIDTPTWRKISYLADIRNLCSHKKDAEPAAEQVDELIQGAEWLTKNVF